MRRTVIFLVTILITIFFGFEVSAQGWVDFRNYIAQPHFVPHTLSTGEHIHFTGEPGSGGVRQYKNTNYEQFFIRGDGYYRREDTSWAPVMPGFQDALCVNGNKAIYALYPQQETFNPGDEVTGTGSFWAPTGASVGDSWLTGAHMIVPVDSGVRSGEYNYNLPPLYACELTNLSGYPAWVPEGSQTIEFSRFYGPNEFEFCTGITNPANLIVLRVLSGPGQGDTFYFMEGWGLVGFETVGWEAGLLSGEGIPEGDASLCRIDREHLPDRIPRTIVGRVVSTLQSTRDNYVVTQTPVEGATLCVYQGRQTGLDGIGETILDFEATARTNEHGYFFVDTYLRPNSFFNTNFMGVLCGNEIHEVIQVGLNHLQQDPLANRYHAYLPRARVGGGAPRGVLEFKIPLLNGTSPTGPYPKYPFDFDFSANRTVLAPVELALKCPPNPGEPNFSSHPAVHFSCAESEDCPTYNQCPAELYYTDRTDLGTGHCGPGSQVSSINRAEPQHTGHLTLTEPRDGSLRGTSLDEPGFLDRFLDAAGNIVNHLIGFKYEGPIDTRAWYGNWEQVTSALHFLTGSPGAFLQGGFYWETCDRHRPWCENIEVVPCEFIRKSNNYSNSYSSYTSIEEMNLNSQGVAGFITLLQPPYGDNNALSLVNIYWGMNREDWVICTLDTGQEVLLSQIRPPTTWWHSEHNNSDEEYCHPEEEGCHFLLTEDYIPYSFIWRHGFIDGHHTGQLIDIKTEAKNNSYGTVEDGAYRTEKFYADYEPTVLEEEHARNYSRPVATGSANSLGLAYMTVPEREIEDPEGRFGDLIVEPGLRSLHLHTYNETPPELVIGEPGDGRHHTSIKGFDHCMISNTDIDPHREHPFTRTTLLQEPAHPEDALSIPTGSSAAQYNLLDCTIINNEVRCEETPRGYIDPGGGSQSNMTFYGWPIFQDLWGTIEVIFYELVKVFAPPEEGCILTREQEGCTPCREGEDPERDLCDPDCECVFVCDPEDPGDIERCEVCTVTTEEYDCYGIATEFELEVEGNSEVLDMRYPLQETEKIAAGFLPPEAAKEFARRGITFTTDVYGGPQFQENSIGIERHGTEYSTLTDGLRQAVGLHINNIDRPVSSSMVQNTYVGDVVGDITEEYVDWEGVPDWHDLPEGTISVVFQRGARRCGIMLRDMVTAVNNTADRFGIPREVLLALWVQESRLSQYIQIGEDGECGMIRNTAGAYCTAQVYRPRGATIINPDGSETPVTPVHPNYTVEGLYDLNYCLDAGATILRNFYRRADVVNWHEAVACYQGIPGCDTSNRYFVDGYWKWYLAGGFYDAQEDIYVRFVAN